MPQSSGSLPSPIARRSAMIFSTRGCSLKPAGTSVTRCGERLSASASGTVVSAFSVQCRPMNGVQSTANGGL